MQSMTRAVCTRRHLSRHERQCQARAEAVSRRTTAAPIVPSLMRLAGEDLELTDRLVRCDRTAVSTALRATAAIGAGGATRRAVLASVTEATCWAQAAGAFSSERSEQIARHVQQATRLTEVRGRARPKLDAARRRSAEVA
jgi:hypothetical protein